MWRLKDQKKFLKFWDMEILIRRMNKFYQSAQILIRMGKFQLKIYEKFLINLRHSNKHNRLKKNERKGLIKLNF